MAASQLASCGSILKIFDAPSYQMQHSYVPFNGNAPTTSMSMSVGTNNYFVAVSETSLLEVGRITPNGIKSIENIKNFDFASTATFGHTSKQFIGLGSSKGNVGVYDLKLKSIKSFPFRLAPIIALKFNSTDKYIAAGCENGEVVIISNEKNLKSSVLKIDDKNPSFSALNFHPCAKQLLTACDHYGSVAVWDINIKKPKSVLRSMHLAPSTDVAFSPINTSLVISVSYDKTFNCYDLNSHKRIISQKMDQALCSLAIHPNGKCLTLGSKQGLIYFIDLRSTDKVLQVIEADKTEIHTLEHTLDSRTSGATYRSFKIDSTFHSSPIADVNHSPISNGSISSTNLSFLEAIAVSGPVSAHETTDSFLNFDVSSKSPIPDDHSINDTFKENMDLSDRNLENHSINETPKENIIEPIDLSDRKLEREKSVNKVLENQSEAFKSVMSKMEMSQVEMMEMFKHEINKLSDDLKNWTDKKMAEQFENMRMFDINLKMTMYKQFINHDYRNLGLQKELLDEVHELREENAELRRKLQQYFDALND